MPIRYFLIFALKHRLCEYLRIASRVPTIYVLSKNKKNIKIFQRKNVIFTAVKIAVYIGMFVIRHVKIPISLVVYL